MRVEIHQKVGSPYGRIHRIGDGNFRSVSSAIAYNSLPPAFRRLFFQEFSPHVSIPAVQSLVWQVHP